MKILIGCERSGVVRREFRIRGHEAYSNDLVPADDLSPFHYQCDVMDALEAEEWRHQGTGSICYVFRDCSGNGRSVG